MEPLLVREELASHVGDGYGELRNLKRLGQSDEERNLQRSQAEVLQNEKENTLY